jgi:thiol-disulfide isomerase/thioredoxin
MHSGIALFLLFLSAASAQIVPQVRRDLSNNDFAAAEKRIAEYRAAHGVTPEMLEAFSWLGRGALAAGKYGDALENAAETRRLVMDEMKKRPLDAEKRLPIALGASIEVQGHALAQQGNRSEAVSFLQGELKRWRNTSIRTRIQKNINLLTLEGKPAPALFADQWITGKSVSQADWKGRPVLLFFWAHWCGDCKNQAPALAQLLQEYQKDGLLVVAPTQPYGVVGGGLEAPIEKEIAYIREIWGAHYPGLGDAPVPVSEENFKNYGASTTPTLVLVNRGGIVTLYHPGHMSLAELKSRIAEALDDSRRRKASD